MDNQQEDLLFYNFFYLKDFWSDFAKKLMPAITRSKAIY